jgi:hypothetical protein
MFILIYLCVCYDSRDFCSGASFVNRKYTENMYIYRCFLPPSVYAISNRVSIFSTYELRSSGNRRSKVSKPDAMHVPPNLLECGPVRLSFAVLIKFNH